MPAPITGQVSVTGSALSLTGNVQVNCIAFLIKTPATNVNAVYIGPAGVTTSNGYPLLPGEVFTYERNSQLGAEPFPLEPSDIFVVGTAGSDKIAWFASP